MTATKFIIVDDRHEEQYTVNIRAQSMETNNPHAKLYYVDEKGKTHLCLTKKIGES